MPIPKNLPKAVDIEFEKALNAIERCDVKLNRKEKRALKHILILEINKKTIKHTLAKLEDFLKYLESKEDDTIDVKVFSRLLQDILNHFNKIHLESSKPDADVAKAIINVLSFYKPFLSHIRTIIKNTSDKEEILKEIKRYLKDKIVR